MPRKRELTWFAPRRCWKKVHQGKTYYFGGGKCRGKTDQNGYKAALEEWHQMKDRVEAEATPAVPEPQRAVLEPPPDDLEDFLGDDSHNAEYAALVGRIWPIIRAGLVDARQLSQARRILQYGIAGIETASPVVRLDSSGRISDAIGAWLKHHQREAEAGQKSTGMYSENHDRIQAFREFSLAHGLNDLTQIDEQVLEAFRAAQLSLLADKKISETTASKRLGALVRFLNWCHDQRLVDRLPRNLKRGYATIRRSEPTPEFFTVEELRRLYGMANRRTRLYILLGLNCGYTQIDIATLEHGMVNWETGMIDRRRHKARGKKKGPPQPSRLWPLTLELLKAEATEAKAGLVLVGDNGNPLVHETIKETGKTKKTDAIAQAFNRLKKKTNKEAEKIGKEKMGSVALFKNFRKTGANDLLEQNQETPHLADLYLAHRDRGMRVHYTQQHYDLMFQATDRLNVYYGLGSGEDVEGEQQEIAPTAATAQ